MVSQGEGYRVRDFEEEVFELGAGADVATLERWLEQALDAGSAIEALR